MTRQITKFFFSGFMRKHLFITTCIEKAMCLAFKRYQNSNHRGVRTTAARNKHSEKLT